MRRPRPAPWRRASRSLPVLAPARPEPRRTSPTATSASTAASATPPSAGSPVASRPRSATRRRASSCEARARPGRLPELPPEPRLHPGGHGLRRLPQGRAPRRAGHACETCHTPSTWSNQREMFQVHNRTRFPLFAVAREAGLPGLPPRPAARPSTRPRPPSAAPAMPATYERDHEPEPRPAGFSRRCEDCHRVTARAGRARPSRTRRRFPLAGGHAGLACARCHAGRRLTRLADARASPATSRTTPRASEPQPRRRRLPDARASPATRARAGGRPAFDHAATRFPLTGAHTAGRVRPLPRGRPATRAPPRTALAATRRTTTAPRTRTTGGGASRPRARAATPPEPGGRRTSTTTQTRFPLTGAHQRVDCARCHVGGRYTGTPDGLLLLPPGRLRPHHEPEPRAAGFPTQCETCHTTNAWRPANFDHDGRYFPIYSGKHRGKWTSCADCHVNAGNYRAFECILCHEHSNHAEVDTSTGESGYAYQSAACYRCHRDGRRTSVGSSPAAMRRSPWRIPRPSSLPVARPSAAACRPGRGDVRGHLRGLLCVATTATTPAPRNPRPRPRSGAPPSRRRTAITRRPGSRHRRSTTAPSSRSTRASTTAPGRLSDCHKNAGTTRAFECIRRHEHSTKSTADTDHNGVPRLPVPQPWPATTCHPQAKPRNARRRRPRSPCWSRRAPVRAADPPSRSSTAPPRTSTWTGARPRACSSATAWRWSPAVDRGGARGRLPRRALGLLPGAERDAAGPGRATGRLRLPREARRRPRRPVAAPPTEPHARPWPRRRAGPSPGPRARRPGAGCEVASRSATTRCWDESEAGLDFEQRTGRLDLGALGHRGQAATPSRSASAAAQDIRARALGAADAPERARRPSLRARPALRAALGQLRLRGRAASAPPTLRRHRLPRRRPRAASGCVPPLQVGGFVGQRADLDTSISSGPGRKYGGFPAPGSRAGATRQPTTRWWRWCARTRRARSAEST